MDLKNELKLAIESSDWSGVCSFYNRMFGEQIKEPSGPPSFSINNQVIDALESIVEVMKSGEKTEPVVIASTEEADNQVQIETFETSAKTEDEETGSSVTFIGSSEFHLPEDDIEGYKEGVEQHQKKRRRATRDSYNPNMMKCSSCGVEFDFNKEYPAGVLDRESKINCNSCRAAGR